jgi:hypothetical protein
MLGVVFDIGYYSGSVWVKGIGLGLI